MGKQPETIVHVLFVGNGGGDGASIVDGVVDDEEMIRRGMRGTWVGTVERCRTAKEEGRGGCGRCLLGDISIRGAG